MTRVWPVLLFSLILVSAAACQTEEEEAATPTMTRNGPRPATPDVPARTATPAVTWEPTPASTPILEVDPAITMESLLHIINQDLKWRIIVTPPEVTVVASEPVVWPDECLGLADPGLCIFDDGETRGRRLVLRAEEQDWVYHASLDGPAFYAGPPNSLEMRVEQAKTIVSREQGVSGDEIEVARVEQLIRVPRCGVEACRPPLGPQAGYRITLRVRGEDFVRETDR